MALELRCSNHPRYEAKTEPKRFCHSCRTLWLVKNELRRRGAVDRPKSLPLSNAELEALEEAHASREAELLEVMSE
jgi:hypothetical protein